MKLENKLIHTVDIKNETGDVVQIKIDSADMVQVSNIGNVFMEFDKLKTMKLEDGLAFEQLVKELEKIAMQMEVINGYMDKAFGTDLREIAFKGSSSLTVYNDFFHQLSDELTKAGVKVKDYIKEVRKKDVKGKGKEEKDTI